MEDQVLKIHVAEEAAGQRPERWKPALASES